MLTDPLLLEVTEAHLPEHRERLYPPTVALSMFIKQALGGRRLLPKGDQCVGSTTRRRGTVPAQCTHRGLLQSPSAVAR